MCEVGHRKSEASHSRHVLLCTSQIEPCLSHPNRTSERKKRRFPCLKFASVCFPCLVCSGVSPFSLSVHVSIYVFRKRFPCPTCVCVSEFPCPLFSRISLYIVSRFASEQTGPTCAFMSLQRPTCCIRSHINTYAWCYYCIQSDRCLVVSLCPPCFNKFPAFNELMFSLSLILFFNRADLMDIPLVSFKEKEHD